MASKATTTNTAATEQTETPAPLSRADALAALRERGYTGPTSFTVSTLRVVLAWVDSDSPRDADGIPAGVLHAVYPDLRPARAARPAKLNRFQQGYQTALDEIAGLGKDARAIQQWVADNRATVEA